MGALLRSMRTVSAPVTVTPVMVAPAPSASSKPRFARAPTAVVSTMMGGEGTSNVAVSDVPHARTICGSNGFQATPLTICCW